MATGIAIARRRRQLSMSQKLLSGLSGIQRSYISDVESGRRNLSLRNLVALAGALGQSASTLLATIEEICTE
ncbi:MAG: helix-turn-helix transcriptional regulator [Cyanobacteria bacterium SZAS-4]|nr:helix-turn-helix transcriptional regulator [Cyanobacteria bacterium SZAS-4]